MKHLVFGKKDVVMYDSIDELPVRRFHRWQKMLMMAAGVGATLADFDSHIERVVAFLKNEDKDNAIKELENLRQNVNLMQNEVPLSALAFAALVKSVDGVDTDDISEDGLQRTLDMIGEATMKEVHEAAVSSKKKIDHELTLYFPSIFDDVITRQYYDDIKKRTMLILDTIINGESEDKSANIEKLTETLIMAAKPQVWTGSKAVDIQQDKAFEDLCLAISKEFNADAKRFTVLEYYAAQETLAKIAKEREKHARKR